MLVARAVRGNGFTQDENGLKATDPAGADGSTVPIGGV
ncbi:hypothetical protein CITRIK5_20467 [Citricoccus sp. K5]|nr:hypothetical protein CITRIK5_20467 [Citricoccus sp. K5]